MQKTKPKIIFFGTPQFSVQVLEVLKEKNIIPDILVCATDKPKGRKLVITPPPTKVWAQENGVQTILQPAKIDENFIKQISDHKPDICLVVAYGKILPKSILEVCENGFINVHPSLLPELRGSSPMETALLSGLKKTGVTIMEIDEDMDHGPIILQKEVMLSGHEKIDDLEKTMAQVGGELISIVINKIANNEDIPKIPQNHDRATFTKKIKKTDGLISLTDNEEEKWNKFRAYFGWPGVYFFIENSDGSQTRVSIKDAEFINGVFHILRVTPEGKKEMSYADFLKNTN